MLRCTTGSIAGFATPGLEVSCARIEKLNPTTPKTVIYKATLRHIARGKLIGLDPTLGLQSPEAIDALQHYEVLAAPVPLPETLPESAFQCSVLGS
jgi:hypothetical protein